MLVDRSITFGHDTDAFPLASRQSVSIHASFSTGRRMARAISACAEDKVGNSVSTKERAYACKYPMIPESRMIPV